MFIRSVNACGTEPPNEIIAPTDITTIEIIPETSESSYCIDLSAFLVSSDRAV